ncbi:hypothetical protein PIB30_001082 [Stylosanthes scabra]|uniref:H/ACA ribonucleoprotein complex non-core subunit NAF1 n=1 Tax=Stylosanthes scabra TaxID=79078 RepID=A0ABU6U1I5_9FABA|nr:hypothetical protein [Stylosanthes scabra]
MTKTMPSPTRRFLHQFRLYVPEIEEMLEPIVSGSGSRRVVEEHGSGVGTDGANESVRVRILSLRAALPLLLLHRIQVLLQRAVMCRWKSVIVREVNWKKQQQQQSQMRQPQPQRQPETKHDEDYAVADSFINFDYVPEIEEMLEPIVSGSGSTRVVEEHGAGGGADESVNVGALGCCSRISEGIEQISLAGGSGGNSDDHADDCGSKSENSESKSGDSSSSSSLSSSSATSSDVKMEERDGERSEPEEGEIIESDRDDENELEILAVVPSVNATLRPHHQMLPVGVVVSVIGAKVVVEVVENHQPLNVGSILWISERQTPLGLIDEIFGPVKQPYYVVRYNSEDQVPEGIYHGALISFVPEFANVVLDSDADLFEKGYDASGENDEEFSDDEKEAEYMRKLRMAKRGSSDQNVERRRKEGKKSPPEEPLLSLLLRSHRCMVMDSIQGLQAMHKASLLQPHHCLIMDNIQHFQARHMPPVDVFRQRTRSLCGDNCSSPFHSCKCQPSNWNLDKAAIPQPQPQPAALPIGFPTNGIPWFPPNTQIPQQWPLQVVPFQQQLNPNQVLPPPPPPPATMFPGEQPNILAQQAMYPQGDWGQNQMPFGLNMNSSFPQTQHPLVYAGQQGSNSFHSITMLHNNFIQVHLLTVEEDHFIIMEVGEVGTQPDSGLDTFYNVNVMCLEFKNEKREREGKKLQQMATMNGWGLLFAQIINQDTGQVDNNHMTLRTRFFDNDTIGRRK